MAKTKNRLSILTEAGEIMDLAAIDMAGMECCGVKELDGIGGFDTPEDALLGICIMLSSSNLFTMSFSTKMEMKFAHLIFTQAGKTASYGHILAMYLEENRLGNVAFTEPARNPNSGNPIVTFVWTPDKPRLRGWWRRRVNSYNKTQADKAKKAA